MKKIFALVLAGLMIFTFSACAGKDNPGGEKLDDKANEKFEDSLEMFSPEAAEYYLEKATGIKLSEIEPDWEWEYASKYSTLGEEGRGLFEFTKKDGELTDEEMNAFFKKVFDMTASVSDDGYNIIGYEFQGDGEDALSETTLEDALGGWLQGWCFKYNDTFMVVYVGTGYDTDKESTLGKVLYYNSVEVDISEGMQQSWDDLMGYIEENEDEIGQALEDYFN